MTKMSFSDSAFLRLESKDVPMHIAGLQIVELPEDMEGDYFDRYAEVFKQRCKEAPMFNWVLAEAPFGLDYPSMVQGGEMDWDYHLKRVTIETDEEMIAWVEQEHMKLLDRKKPLFQYTVIEGLSGNRAAIYAKTHHSIMDGQTGMQMTQLMFDIEPQGRPPLTEEQIKEWRLDREPAPKPTLLGTLGKTIVERMERPLISQIPPVARVATAAFTETMKQLNRADRGAAALGVAPKTMFNQPVSGQRSFVTGTLPMGEIKEIRKATGATINDIVVSVIGGALRRYLKDFSALPKAPLVCGAPVALDQNADSSNSVSAMAMTFGTDETDPLVRLGKVSQSGKFGKEAFAGLQGTIDGQTNFGLPAYMSAPLMAIAKQKRVMGSMPPFFNAMVSNVPGVPFDLYMAGAKLLAHYPVSIVAHGAALNITLISHKDSMCFGLIACPKAVPELGSMMDYVEVEFEALKKAAFKARDLAAKKAAKAAKQAEEAAPVAAPAEAGEVVKLNVA